MVLSAVPLDAQPLASDGRISAGGGVGLVVNPATCHFCSGGLWPSVSYRVGRTVRHDAVAGFEGMVSRWAGSPACSGSGCRFEPDASFFVAAHAITLQWFPYIERPFFIKVGVGVTTNSARYTFPQDDAEQPGARREVSVISLTPKIGGGVERRISQKVSVALHIDAVRSVRGRIAAGDASLSATLFYIGGGLTYYR